MNKTPMERSELRTANLVTAKELRSTREGKFWAVDPRGDGNDKWEIRVKESLVKRCQIRSRADLLTLAYIVPKACSDPTRIYQGVREEGEQEWLCYCSLPLTRYTGISGTETKSEENEVFLVYVNADRCVYAFNWEQTEAQNSGIPKNEASRFQIRVYP